MRDHVVGVLQHHRDLVRLHLQVTLELLRELLVTHRNLKTLRNRLWVLKLILDRRDQTPQVVCEQLPTEEVLVALGTELLYLSDLLVSHPELGGVLFGEQQHLIVLLPVRAKVLIVLYNQVDSVEAGENRAEIIEYLRVHVVFLKKRFVNNRFRFEQTIHLVDYILSQGNRLFEDFEHVPVYCEHTRHRNL